MRLRTRELLLALGVLPLLVSACGGDDDVAEPDVDGTVEVTMTDNRFEPDRMQVEAGETVTFRFENEGELQHEAFFGNEDEQEAHETEMSEEGSTTTAHDMTTPESEGHDEEQPAHGGEDALTVEAGDSATLEHTFEEAGTILIGCHEPGHYEAGMKVTIEVQ